MNSYELNNGVKIPNIGIGTFLLSPEDAENSVKEALKIGYRLIDTANAYVNERAVGRAIKSSNIKREEIFVSTKLWINEYENPNAVDQTLERLGLDYVDLLFIHQPAGNYMAGYKQLEKAYKEGKAKSIGISNFEGEFIDEILAKCEIVPQVIQVEAHPYFVQEELRKVIDPKNIKLMSWYPLGHGDISLLNEQIFKIIGNKYDKTPAQIILKWHIQMGFIVIPGSKNVEHIKSNFDLFDFELDSEDMDLIATLNKSIRYFNRTDEQLAHLAGYIPQYEQN
ncbi:aldo/keto reductase [Neocallimastix lanati (nom. inval.)]|jgi:diketogulonate reductase-like aldo/keto reductase|uniref:Aldo/keto reductase n=1 Tax=Neocallimastix californiae TaxID=1754190 RepID=A0A1Y2AUE5_9FUNG|nr:aldo/keto reductase [Neocallimastix sp. JGI-2020a]ORY26218.1 aldo/keto reductase [Neocallimastix californiae]|eukprot:ORY26218.1 aldo/keto reductase [Neocallimastix californiae]